MGEDQIDQLIAVDEAQILACAPKVLRILRVEAVDFVQFWAAVFPLANAAGRRRFSMARDWAARALVDDYRASEAGQEVHIERITRFGAVADETLRAQVDHTLLEWTYRFFYVSWATGDLIEMARLAALPLLGLAFTILGGNEELRPLADDALGAAIALTSGSIATSPTTLTVPPVGSASSRITKDSPRVLGSASRCC